MTLKQTCDDIARSRDRDVSMCPFRAIPLLANRRQIRVPQYICSLGMKPGEFARSASIYSGRLRIERLARSQIIINRAKVSELFCFSSCILFTEATTASSLFRVVRFVFCILSVSLYCFLKSSQF